jgi:hypothetical protein
MIMLTHFEQPILHFTRIQSSVSVASDLDIFRVGSGLNSLRAVWRDLDSDPI